MRTFSNFLKISIFALVTTAVILLGLEALVFSVYKITKNYRFSPISKEEDSILPEGYPKTPQDHVKIAIFGGSAADGAGSERAFYQMLKVELGKLFPKKKIYIKSFAERGQPFHRYEAELAKSAVQDFDVLLIYAGTNEFLNYIDDTGYFRKPEYKSLKTQAKPNYFSKLHSISQQSKWNHFLLTKSHLYGTLLRINNRYFSQYFNLNPYTLVTRFEEISSNPALPPLAVEEFVKNYETDLLEVLRLTKENKKEVVIAAEMTELRSKPFFSYKNFQLSQNEAAKAYQYYQNAKKLFENKSYTNALAEIERALKIDNQTSIFHHTKATILWEINKKDDAVHSFRQAINRDALPNRCIDSIFDVASKSAQKFDHVFYFDSRPVFYDHYKNGSTQFDLFSDILHPTFYGNVLLTKQFLCQLVKTKALRSLEHEKTFCAQDFDYKALEKSLTKTLSVTDADRVENEFSSARMNVSWASRAFYREEFLYWASVKLDRYLQFSKKTNHDYAVYYLYRFFIEGQGEARQSIALDFIKKAFAYEPDYIDYAVVKENLATGEITRDILSRLGISYLGKSKGFETKK